MHPKETHHFSSKRAHPSNFTFHAGQQNFNVSFDLLPVFLHLLGYSSVPQSCLRVGGSGSSYIYTTPPSSRIQWGREVACGGLTDGLSSLEISSRGADGNYPSHQKACNVLARSKCICSTSSKGQPMSELLQCWIDPQCPSAPPLGTHVTECPSLLLTGAWSSAQMFSIALAMARVLERVTSSPDI